MLQGFGDTVLRAEVLEKELSKARKHSAMLQSKLDGAFTQYHNEVQDMQAKSDELVRKNNVDVKSAPHAKHTTSRIS
jgi:predicted  nucleic acid-binding Zn-ribbon protein